MAQLGASEGKEPMDLPTSMARDLYDIIERDTSDHSIKGQMALGQEKYKDRLKTIQYINHRLNLGI